MSAILTIARKELRALFLSPVALLFLGVFLFITNFTFFTLSGFFARNLADVRPLFQWMPVLLILLVSATSMRQWAEERKMGTLEILLTLPVRTGDLVLGKFLAGMALVLVALLLTLPIPIAVSFMGDLDWGPVVGGFLGALLLASAYMAIGLCISAATDNQVVSLMVTLAVGALVYLMGAESFTGMFDTSTAGLLSLLGTGSRFESVERGVIDLRDLTYYGSLTAFFLVLNTHLVDRLRMDAHTSGGRRRSIVRWVTTLLFAANALALNLWLAPVQRARLDVTSGGEYSVSPATRDVLAALDEPLVIQGVFSAKTHPKLAPLVAKIKDYLEEYEVAGKGRVKVEFIDPATDATVEQELNEQYGIKSFPFRISGRNEQSVVNSYCHVLIKYGDKHEVLSWEDLIDVQMTGDSVQVRLRNLEYDVTRSIKRVSQEFQSLDAIFAGMNGTGALRAYVSSATVPADMSGVPAIISKLGRELAAQSGGRLTFTESDPVKDPAMRRELDEKYGIAPIPVDLFGREVYYLHVVLEMGGKVQVLKPKAGTREGDLRNALVSSIKRATPGNLKTVAVFTETPVAPPQNPNLPPQYQQPTPRPDYQGVQQLLQTEHQVRQEEVKDGLVPDDVDVLVVAKPGSIDDKQAFAVDQFLMRGGSVIVLAGRYGLDVKQGGLTVKKIDGKLQELLAKWGVYVGDGLVMDPQNASFPMPVQEKKGPFTVQRIQYLDYPFFPDIRAEGFAKGHPALAGLNNVTMPWSSPLELANVPPGVSSERLLQTTDRSWLQSKPDISPDFKSYPGKGFAPEGSLGTRLVAVALRGTFPSFYADKPSPLADPGAPSAGIVKLSLPDARLVVLGSAEMDSDILLSLARQQGGEVHRGNLQLLQNLIDWSVEDTDLLLIRAHSAAARTLDPMEPSQVVTREIYVGIVMLLGLGVVVVVPRVRRRRTSPIVREAA